METKATKVMKAWRLSPEVVDALREGARQHHFSEETAYVEAVLRAALGLKPLEQPKPPKVAKKQFAPAL